MSCIQPFRCSFFSHDEYSVTSGSKYPQLEMLLLAIMVVSIGLAAVVSTVFLLLSVCMSCRRRRVIYLMRIPDLVDEKKHGKFLFLSHG